MLSKGIKYLSVLGGLLVWGPTWATEGPVDSYGCHTNMAMAIYHCHSGPMAGKSFKSKKEMLQALQELTRQKRREARIQTKP